MRLSFILFIFFIKSVFCFSSDKVEIRSIFYLEEDKQNITSPFEIRSQQFLQLEDSVQLTKEYVWFKIRIINQGNETFFNLCLNLKSESNSIYQAYKNTIIAFGDAYVKPLFGFQDVKKEQNWKIYIPANSVKEFFVKCYHVRKQQFNANQISVNKFDQSIVRWSDFLFIGFENAVFIIIIFISAFAYFLFYETVYLYFIAYIFSNLVMFLGVHNIFGQYIFNNYYLNYTLRIFSPIALIAYTYFLYDSLNLKNNLPRLYQYFLRYLKSISNVIQILFIIILFVNYDFYNRYIYIDMFSLSTIFVFIIIYSFKYFNKYEKLIALGLLILYCSAFIRIYQNDYTYSSYHTTLEVGLIIEILIFAYTLLYRTKLVIAEKKALYKKNTQLKTILNQAHSELITESIASIKQIAINDQLYSKPNNVKSDTTFAQEELNRIEAELGRGETNEEIWNRFMELFDKAHNNFITKLKSKYPLLTITEIRICCFLLISMKSKDIANITGKTERNIEVIRNRIRKKLEIPKDVSIPVFLMKI